VFFFRGNGSRSHRFSGWAGASVPRSPGPGLSAGAVGFRQDLAPAASPSPSHDG